MIQELKKEYKDRTGGRLQTKNGHIVVYHGTSRKAADKIIKDNYFKDGFFTGSKQPMQYGDSVDQYAKIRARQAGEKGRGIVLKMIVNVY